MITRHKKISALWVCSVTLLSVLCIISSVSAVAVMSVDLGTEWMKVAVVSPGVPMEIALSKESKRKSPVAIAFRDGERMFGAEAMATAVKYPKACYMNFLDLLGKKTDDELVKAFSKKFPYYTIVPCPERDTVCFKHDEETTYSVEELVAMILAHAKSIAESFANQKVKDAVITTPVFFNEAERRALMSAADLAGVNVLQLFNAPMATALNYGMFRRKDINTTAKHLMFYDMGSSATTASVVSFQVIKSKERGFTESHPQAQILGISYDRTLGGLELRLRLRDYLADQFNKLGKTKTDVTKVDRAMGKLYKEAERVKLVLSANTECYAQVENLLEDIDFKLHLTRDKLVKLYEDYLVPERITRPMIKALEVSGLSMTEISEVVLMGAGTRLPKIQEFLLAYLNGRELGKSLNTDEAAAMGAVYKAADLSSGFKVKKFITRDAVVFPIDVNFERHFEDDEGKPAKKTVNKALFGRMNPFPQKKIMTFNKFQDDFEFHANMNALELENSEIGHTGLSSYTVMGLKAAMENHTGDNIESKGVKAHFNLDDNGILSVTTVEAAFEQTISVEQQIKEELEKKSKDPKDNVDGKEPEDENDETWSKTFGDSITNFFGDKDGKESGDNEEAKDTDDKGKKDKKQEDKKKKEKEDKKKKEKEEKKKETEKKKEKPKEPKIIHIKEPLQFESKVIDLIGLKIEQFNTSKEKLNKLDEVDRIKRERETTLNDLESFVLRIKEKLYEEIYEKSSTEEERQKYQDKCAELSDWIDEEVGPFTEIEILKTKLDELKTLTKDLFLRVEEHEGRPEILEALNSMVNSSEHFLAKAKTDTESKAPEDAYFTISELELLEKKINETKSWIETKMKIIEAQPMHEFPTVNNKLIAVQGMDLDREVKYLVNKAKIAKQERDRLKREKELKEKEEKEKEEKAKKKKAKKDKKAKDKNTTDEEKSDSTTNVNEELENVEDEKETTLDESFGEDTMGANEATQQNEGKSGDELDVNVEEKNSSEKDEAPGDEQTSDGSLPNSENEISDEKEPLKQEL